MILNSKTDWDVWEFQNSPEAVIVANKLRCIQPEGCSAGAREDRLGSIVPRKKDRIALTLQRSDRVLLQVSYVRFRAISKVTHFGRTCQSWSQNISIVALPVAVHRHQ